MLTKKDPSKNAAKNDSKNTKNPSPQPENSGSCCMPPVKAPTQMPTTTEAMQQGKKGAAKTRITVKYDIGFSNQLYIRGQGANLSWDKGQPFKNVKSDEWVWETDTPFTRCEFKVLINDRIYETGDNHVLNHGAALLYTPHF